MNGIIATSVSPAARGWREPPPGGNFI